MIVANDRQNRPATAAIFAGASNGGGDGFEIHVGPHNPLNDAGWAIPLPNVEHLAVEGKFGRLIHIRGNFEVTERHTRPLPLATRQRGIAPQAGALSKLLILSNVPALTIDRLRTFKRIYFAMLRAASLITLGIVIGIGIEAVSAAKLCTAAFHQFAIEHRTPPER